MSFTIPRPSSSSSSLPKLRTLVQRRCKHTHSTPQSLWLSRTHLNPAPSVPPPMVPTYPMRVILSDGSTFTAYTTAPTPSTKKLTRDVLNNPLWSPASERRGLGEGEEGRVGRFRKRFEGIAMEDEQASEGNKPEAAFAAGDLDWMSEGGVEEKISEKQRNPVKAAKGKGKKK
ncbi:uncharacterized protein IL334_007782 [Kwoniella shivajii]|uniref:Uncharacterized protein n=1 Tax=Kwoniella shivajii TaxID=564305 RepID=A0ABZ1DAG5_9TREE|nr:hypothetical protein IL334_007782 [Kwoniella shivajii]